ncbi:MAG: hypothetical protein E4H41_06160 [Gemmatimonadales bacterium]|nr:MAG: hypothetical protein E4H41_06160 [Gemmatimonadales bacterium]
MYLPDQLPHSLESLAVQLANSTRRTAHSLAGALVVLALSASIAAAQVAPVTRDSITLAPGPQFSTTSWVRWLATPIFGSRYRKLWRTPITLPILDLQATHGGLRLAGTGQGSQAGLAFMQASDGSQWTFWPLDRVDPRDTSNVIPGNISRGLIADFTSGRNPAGPLVAAALAEAAGVPNATGWLVVLPNDSSLSMHGTSYAGKPGYLVQRDPSARGDSTGPVHPGDVISSMVLLHRILNYPAEQVDAEATLQALLFNVYVSNLNPTFLNWRWEAVAGPDGIVWRPLGLFRETALAQYDGLATYLARPLMPDLARFQGRYPHALTGVPDQAAAFRFLVGSLGRPAWDSIASALQVKLTDSVISTAVSTMPAPYLTQIGPKIEKVLRERRDNLPIAVGRMFKQVRSEAEVHGTTAADQVTAQWLTPDSLALSFGPREQLFSARETNRVDLFLLQGTDTILVTGVRGKGPELRIVPTPPASLHVVDSTGSNTVQIRAKGVPVSIDPPGAVPVRSTIPPNALLQLDSAGVERTDGKRALSPTVVFSIASGTGVLIGGGAVRTDWSGDARPYRSRTTLRAAYGTESNKGVVELETDFRWTHSPLQLHVNAIASGVTAIYFYGFGNETSSTNSGSYYRAGRDIYALVPSVLYPVSKRVRLGAGLNIARVVTPMDSGLFISVNQPYGTPTFSAAGVDGSLTYDSRDVRGAPRHGALALVKGAWYPVVSGSGGTFGTVSASVASYVTPHWWRAMTIATRLSGTATFGEVPYFESAFIGGGRTVRGLPQGRYEGNQALFGNLDLRLRVSRIQFVLPWDFGVLGLADLGRVFVSGESSKEWHPSVGGGVWVALLDRSLAASLNVATGAGQGVFLNAGAGFSF